ncbi:MAG: MFS transporter [Clostridia bacterium]|nr:MFS transporter [Clostridia bacterium]
MKKKIHYGWVIVLASALYLGFGMGMLSNTAGLYIKPVCQDLGFQRGSFTLHRTILTFVSVLMTPVFARAIPKFGIKKIMLVCGIGLSLLTVCFGFATSLIHFYIIGILYGLLSNGISFFLIGTLMNYWFKDKKGLAIGISYCGSNIGGAITISVIGNLMDKIGWRLCYIIPGLIGVITLVPIVLFLVKEKPEDMGLMPYTENRKEDTAGQEVSYRGVLLSDARKMPVYFILLISFFFFSMTCGGPSSHLNAYLSDCGYPTVLVTTLHSFFQISVAFNKVFIGNLLDKVGLKKGGIILSISCIAAMVLALFIHIPAIAWIHVFLLGVICASYSIAVNMYVSIVFGNLNFSTILSKFTMATTLGAALSNPFMGSIFDSTGSYRLSWLVLIGCAVISSIGLMISTKKKKTELAV